MPTMHINWHKLHRIPTMEGEFIKRDIVTIGGSGSAPISAPDGAEYATIWADAAFAFRLNATALADANARALPASSLVQITDVKGSQTSISGITI